MKKTKWIEKKVEITEDIICNKCGKSCIPKTNLINEAYGLIEASVSGGYDSIFLRDEQSYTFSLCEECLKEMFDNFLIPPKNN